MLEVGNPGLTLNEARAHFTMWCMLAAPLITGNDLRNMSDEIKEILTNRNLIAVDQDSMGRQGFKVWDDGNFEIWQKPLAGGDIAVCLLNLEIGDKKFTVEWDNMRLKGLEGKYRVKNLWKDTVQGNTGEIFTVTVPARDVVMYRLIKVTE
jgi:alpha-galactosidase